MGCGAIVILLLVAAWVETAESELYSLKLVHRFSEEVRAAGLSRSGRGVNATNVWHQKKGSSVYYRKLLRSDLQRQQLNLGPQFQYLFPSQGSSTVHLGNDFGWLHYTWIDIGTPSVSFLVALDTGSDLLWVPCNCMQCAPLSARFYNNLDKDLNQYNPSLSTTKKDITCSHQLCKLTSNCKSPKQPCPYTVNYDSDDTSTSGLLVQDILHLASGSADLSHKSVRAPVIIGCASKQSGEYLTGVAPDGLMGLGPGQISIPSFLAKAGLTRNSFSLCFKEDDSGRMFLGDQGIASQSTAQFISSDVGNTTYLVHVEAFCVGNSCLEKMGFTALIDSGTSFTYLPKDVYQRVVGEFDRQVDATKYSFEGYPWQYCYKSSSQDLPTRPSLSLKFAFNNTYEVMNPIFVIPGSEGAIGFCLAVQPSDGDFATIGQNFMTGHRMVFDRENMKLGWSRSNCDDSASGQRSPLAPSNSSSPKPLPSEQQRTPNGHAVTPAIAGRTQANSVAKSTLVISPRLYVSQILLLLLVALVVV